MKLTPEQIEEEMVKFEERFSDYKMLRIWSMDNQCGFVYLYDETKRLWDGWLACRESNNEVTIPIANNVESHIYQKDVMTFLESQGYTIKELK